MRNIISGAAALLVLALYGRASSQTPATPTANSQECVVACDGLETRTALTLEYEICGRSDKLRTAKTERRLLKIRQDDKLSVGGTCLATRFPAPQISGWIVVPQTSKRRSSGEEATSGDLSLLRACLGAIGAGQNVPPAHRDLTRMALQNTPGFSFEGKLIELASEQADTYEWLNPAAHAQTPDDDQQSPAQAIETYRQHIGSVTSKIRKACCSQNTPAVAYELGYLFHAIQDLATHAGMTNKFHASLLLRSNPDLDSAALGVALKWTKSTLRAYASSSYGACVKDASAIDGANADWDALARAGGYGPADASVTALLEFGRGTLQAPQPPDRSWFKPSGADDWFKRTVMDAVVRATAMTCDEPL